MVDNKEANQKSSSNETRKPSGSTDKTILSPETDSPNAGLSKKSNRQSGLWNGGSWRGKATAVASVAKESASADASGSAERATTSPPPSKRAPRLSTPSKSNAIPASTTRVNVTSGLTEEASAVDKPSSEPNDPAEIKAPTSSGQTDEKDSKQDSTANSDRPVPASGWRGWWTKPENSRSEAMTTELTSPAPVAVEQQHTAVQSTPESAIKHPNKPPAQVTTDVDAVDQPSTNKKQVADQNEPQVSTLANQRYSWFGLWASAPSTTGEAVPNPGAPKSDSVEPSHSRVDAVPEPASPSSQSAAEVAQRSSSGSWAFWSRQSASGTAKTQDEKAPEIGELAIADSPSQSHPQPAKSPPLVKSPDEQKSKKRPRPDSAEIARPTASKKTTSKAQLSVESKGSDSDSVHNHQLQESVLKTSVQPGKSKARKTRQNLLLPSFYEAGYRIEHTPTYWEQISRVLSRQNVSGAKQVTRLSTPAKLKHAVAIGVHGYIPNSLVQKVLGQPTGTSIKFADMAASAIEEWTTERNWSLEIEKVALEGEGMIAHRIDTLWKLLLNWIDSIRTTDFIMVACHSQGVPVAVSLVARLVNFGCVQKHTRIGICAMAGINLGPFISYQTRLFGSSAGELFDFSNPASTVSRQYASALALILRNHVRLILIGSIDDQLVSMESSTFSCINHPYIYRAVFVDGRIHAPDFLTHLVGFTLKLRNLGLPDHGLIRELSGPLAGSLYTGEGHSRIYEEQDVYKTAIQFALETADLPTAQVPEAELKPYEPPDSSTPNPYFLPWAMRGLLEENFVKTQLHQETDELLKKFNDWKPQSKVLKDVKFRLEAVQSKL